MLFDDNPEASFEVLEMLHADRFSHQSRDPVAPFVVQAFHDAGVAASLVARSVLPRPEQLGIRFIEVGINQFPPVVCGQ